MPPGCVCLVVWWWLERSVKGQISSHLDFLQCEAEFILFTKGNSYPFMEQKVSSYKDSLVYYNSPMLLKTHARCERTVLSCNVWVQKNHCLPPWLHGEMLCAAAVTGAGCRSLPAQRCPMKQREPSLHQGCFPCACGSRGHRAAINCGEPGHKKGRWPMVGRGPGS